MVLNALALLRVELGWNFLEVAACITQCNQMAEITHLRVDLCYFFVQVFFELPQALVHAHRSILEKISRSTLKGALILEDVFFFYPKFF